MRFKDSVAVVTGGASGIGEAIADALVAEGARVVVADLQEPKARTGGALTFFRHDIASEASWRALLADMNERQLPFNLLFNCAGVLKGIDLEATDVPLFDRLMSVNAGGTFIGCRLAIGAWTATGREAAIVNIASTSAVKPASWIAAYAASKAAVVSMTRSVALHCAERGLPIRCNALLPGVVRTPMVTSLVESSPDPEAALAAFAEQHPTKRLVLPAEVASAALFLASREASAITGASLAVDAGMTAG